MNRTSPLLSLLAALGFVISADARSLDGYVTIYPISVTDMQFSSYGRATCYNDLNQVDSGCSLSGSHEVSGPYTFTTPVTGSGKYSNTLEGPAEPGACYDAHLSVTADPSVGRGTLEGGWAAINRCAPTPPPPPPPGGDEVPQCGGGGPYEDCSPIVINFGGPYELTGSNAPVSFDINATGAPERIGWTAAGSDEAFLWLDRNANGVVDDGSELFGTATRLQDGSTAANGFEALLEHDQNGDARMDSSDAVWPLLRLWRDANHNGATEAEEIIALSNSAVRRLDLDYHWTGRRDEHGNRFKYESRVWLTRPSGIATPRPVYDIFFVGVPAN